MVVKKVRHTPTPRSDRPDIRKVDRRKHPAPSKAKSKKSPDTLSALGNLARDTFTLVTRPVTTRLIAGAVITGAAVQKVRETAEPVVRHVRHGYQQMMATLLATRTKALPLVYETMARHITQALTQDADTINLDATSQALDTAEFFVGKYEQLGRLAVVSDMDPQAPLRYQAAWTRAVETRDGKQIDRIHQRHILVESVGALEESAASIPVPKPLKDAAQLMRRMAGDLDDPLAEDEDVPRHITAAGTVASLIRTHRAADAPALGTLPQTVRMRETSRAWVLQQVERPELLWEDGAEKIAVAAEARTQGLHAAGVLAESRYVHPASRDVMLNELETNPASKRAQTVGRYARDVLAPREQAMAAWKQLHPSMGYRDARRLEYTHDGWGGVPADSPTGFLADTFRAIEDAWGPSAKSEKSILDPSATCLNDNPITRVYRQWKAGNPYDREQAVLVEKATKKFIDRLNDIPLEPTLIALASDADWDRFDKAIDVDVKSLGALTRLLGKAEDAQRPAEASWKDKFIQFKFEANRKLGVEGRAGANVTDAQAMRSHYKPSGVMLRVLSDDFPHGIPAQFAKEQLAAFREASPDSPVARSSATVYELYLFQQYKAEQHHKLMALAGRDNPDKDVRSRAEMLSHDFSHDKYYWLDAEETFAPIARFSDTAEAFHRDVLLLESLRALEEMRLGLEGKDDLLKEYGRSKTAGEKVLYVTGGWITERWRAAGLVGAKQRNNVGSLLFEIAKAKDEVRAGEMGRHRMLTQVNDKGSTVRDINKLAEEAQGVIAYRDLVQDIGVMAVATAATAGVGAAAGLAARSGKLASDAMRAARVLARIVAKQGTFLHVNALGKLALRGQQDLYDRSKGVGYNLYNLGVQIAEFELMVRAHHSIKGIWKVGEAAKYASRIRTALSVARKFSHEVIRDTAFFHGWTPLGAGIRGFAHFDARAIKEGFEALTSAEGFRHTLVFTIGMGVPLGQPLSARAVKLALERKLPEMKKVAVRQEKIARLEKDIAANVQNPARVTELRHQQLQLARQNEAVLDRLTAKFDESEELRQQWQVMSAHHTALRDQHLAARFNKATARHRQLSQQLTDLQEAPTTSPSPPVRQSASGGGEGVSFGFAQDRLRTGEDASHSKKTLRTLRQLEAVAFERAALADKMRLGGRMDAGAAIVTGLQAIHARNTADLVENGHRIQRIERVLQMEGGDAATVAPRTARLLLAYRIHLQLMTEANALEPGRFEDTTVAKLRGHIHRLKAALPSLEPESAKVYQEAVTAAEDLHRGRMAAVEKQLVVVRGIAKAEADAKSEKSILDPFVARARKVADTFKDAWDRATAAGSTLRAAFTRALLLPVAPIFGAVGPVGGGGGRAKASVVIPKPLLDVIGLHTGWSMEGVDVAEEIQKDPQRAASAIISQLRNLIGVADFVNDADPQTRRMARSTMADVHSLLGLLRQLPPDVRPEDRPAGEPHDVAFIRALRSRRGCKTTTDSALKYIDAEFKTRYSEILGEDARADLIVELAQGKPELWDWKAGDTIPRLDQLVQTGEDITLLMRLGDHRADVWPLLHKLADANPELFTPEHKQQLEAIPQKIPEVAATLDVLARTRLDLFSDFNETAVARLSSVDCAQKAAELRRRLTAGEPWERTVALGEYKVLLGHGSFDAAVLRQEAVALVRDAAGLEGTNLRRHQEAFDTLVRQGRYTHDDMNVLVGSDRFAPPAEPLPLSGEAQARFEDNLAWWQGRYTTSLKVSHGGVMRPMFLMNVGGTPVQFYDMLVGQPHGSAMPFKYEPRERHAEATQAALNVFNLNRNGRHLGMEVHISFPELLEFARANPDAIDPNSGYISIKGSALPAFQKFLRERHIPVRLLVPMEEGDIRVPVLARQPHVFVRYLSARDPALSKEAQAAKWAGEAALKPASAPPRIDTIRAELAAYGERHQLRGLEGRIQRGLDPASMLAVSATRSRLEAIASTLGARMEDVIALTNELHVGGIWKNADRLAASADPAVRVWMIAMHLCHEGELDEAGFLKDYDRVVAGMDRAVRNPAAFAAEAKAATVDAARARFALEDGIPVSTHDAFTEMAVCGHHSGIVKDASGILFVGADKLDYSVLEKIGLRPIQREDRGRMATFYVNTKGVEVVKKLYDGFCIVLTADMAVAKALARTAMPKKSRAFADTQVVRMVRPGGDGVGPTGGKSSPATSEPIPPGVESEGYKLDRTLDEYDGFTMQTPLGTMDGAVENMLSTRKAVNILELGPGDGNAARQLKDKFGDLVSIEAVSLYPGIAPENKSAFDSVKLADVNVPSPADFARSDYDLIVSVYGGPYYAQNPEAALCRVADHLKVGGQAVITLQVNIEVTTPAFTAAARALGLEITRRNHRAASGRGVQTVYIKRTQPGSASAILNRAATLSELINIQEKALPQTPENSTSNISIPYFIRLNRAAQAVAKAKKLSIEVGYRLQRDGAIRADWENLQQEVQAAMDAFLSKHGISKTNNRDFKLYYDFDVKTVVSAVAEYGMPIDLAIQSISESVLLNMAQLTAVGGGAAVPAPAPAFKTGVGAIELPHPDWDLKTTLGIKAERAAREARGAAVTDWINDRITGRSGPEQTDAILELATAYRDWSEHSRQDMSDHFARQGVTPENLPEAERDYNWQFNFYESIARQLMHDHSPVAMPLRSALSRLISSVRQASSVVHQNFGLAVEDLQSPPPKDIEPVDMPNVLTGLAKLKGENDGYPPGMEIPWELHETARTIISWLKANARFEPDASGNGRYTWKNASAPNPEGKFDLNEKAPWPPQPAEDLRLRTYLKFLGWEMRTEGTGSELRIVIVTRPQSVRGEPFDKLRAGPVEPPTQSMAGSEREHIFRTAAADVLRGGTSVSVEPFAEPPEYKTLNPTAAVEESRHLRDHFSIDHLQTVMRAVSQFDALVRLGKLDGRSILDGAGDLAATLADPNNPNAAKLKKYMRNFLGISEADPNLSTQQQVRQWTIEIAAAWERRALAKGTPEGGGPGSGVAGSGGTETLASFPANLQPLWEGARNFVVTHAAPAVGRATRAAGAKMLAAGRLIAGAVRGWLASAKAAVSPALPAPKVKSQYLTPLVQTLDALWATSEGRVEVDDKKPASHRRPEEMPKAAKMVRALVESRARELGVAPGDVCVTVAGPGHNASEVLLWLRAGARVHVVEPEAGATDSLENRLSRIGMTEDERSRLTISDQKMDERAPSISDIVVWNYPRRTLTRDSAARFAEVHRMAFGTDEPAVGLEPQELPRSLKLGGLLIVQTDFPETYVGPFARGGQSKDFEPVFSRPVDPQNYLLPSGHLVVASTLAIFRRRALSLPKGSAIDRDSVPAQGGVGGSRVRVTHDNFSTILQFALNNAFAVVTKGFEMKHYNYKRDPLMDNPEFRAAIWDLRRFVEAEIRSGRGASYSKLIHEGSSRKDAKYEIAYFQTMADFDRFIAKELAARKAVGLAPRTPPWGLTPPREMTPPPAVAPRRRELITDAPPRVAEVPPHLVAHLDPYLARPGGRLTQDLIAGALGELTTMDDARPKAPLEPHPAVYRRVAYEIYNNPDQAATRAVDVSDVNDRYRQDFEASVLKNVPNLPAHLVPRMNGWYWGGSSALSVGIKGKVRGPEKTSSQGRIYLSLKSGNFSYTGPDGKLIETDDSCAAALYAMLTKMAHDAQKAGHGFEFKVTDKRTSLKRADSAVIYFHAEDQEYIYRCLLKLAQLDLFKDNIPLFAAQLHGSDGRALRGMAFGQSPPDGKSFGDKRASIVRRILEKIEDAESEGRPVSREDVARHIASAFEAAGIDIHNPAFESDGRRVFDFIYHRSSMSREDEVPTATLTPPRGNTPPRGRLGP